MFYSVVCHQSALFLLCASYIECSLLLTVSSYLLCHFMPWLHGPISLSEVLSDVAGPSEVWKPYPKKLDGMCMLILSDFLGPGFLPSSQKMPTRALEVCLCHPTCLISSFKKLGQHFVQENRCVWPWHYVCSCLIFVLLVHVVLSIDWIVFYHSSDEAVCIHARWWFVQDVQASVHSLCQVCVIMLQFLLSFNTFYFICSFWKLLCWSAGKKSSAHFLSVCFLMSSLLPLSLI